jgi:hypothetical protein
MITSGCMILKSPYGGHVVAVAGGYIPPNGGSSPVCLEEARHYETQKKAASAIKKWNPEEEGKE